MHVLLVVGDPMEPPTAGTKRKTKINPLLIKTKKQVLKQKSRKKQLQNTNKATVPFGPEIGLNPASGLLSLAHSPINLLALKQYLSEYHLHDTADYLWEGFNNGFRIPYSGPRIERFSPNHGSARLQPDIIINRLNEEIELGRVAGPFLEPPINNLIISPIGLVPKSTPGEFRLIFDLSYPHGSSINSGISKEDSSVIYTNFDEVIRMVREEGPGSHLFKIDIKSAFRLIPIHPDDFSLLGMEFQGQYYIDKCLPFGLSVSCSIFEKFSTFLEWIIRRNTNSNQMIHYLDDFCGCRNDKEVAKHTLEKALDCFESLGVPIAIDKVEGPATNIKFLGLEIDTLEMLVKIPSDKLIDLKKVINDFIGKKQKKVTLRQLQSLIGKLNFACRAIVPGRAFCRRLIDATMGIKHPLHRIRVTKGMVDDLSVWQEFLENHNGITMMVRDLDEPYLELFTDASGSIGFGAYFKGHWTNGLWPSSIHEAPLDITFKELFPIVLAIFLWGNDFKNCKVLFHCDNMAVVRIINKQSSRDQASMHLVRSLVEVCLEKNIVFKAQHIPGLNNDIADALSRCQFHRFQKLAPQADREATPVPDNLWRKLLGKWTAS